MEISIGVVIDIGIGIETGLSTGIGVRRVVGIGLRIGAGTHTGVSTATADLETGRVDGRTIASLATSSGHRAPSPGTAVSSCNVVLH